MYKRAKTPSDQVQRLNAALLEAALGQDVDAVRGWGFEISAESPGRVRRPGAARACPMGSIVKATGCCGD
jgi:hypothetical protein